MRATISKDLQRFPCRRSKSGTTEDEENILAFLLFVTLFLGGAIRLRLAGRTAAGKSFGGNLQGCCCNSDPRADDWPLADFGDSARCYHPTTWWRHSTQVSGKERKLCVCHRLFIEVACSHFDVTCWFVSKLETLSLVFWPSNFVSLEPEVTNIVVLSPEVLNVMPTLFNMGYAICKPFFHTDTCELNFFSFPPQGLFRALSGACVRVQGQQQRQRFLWVQIPLPQQQ